jgi:hypothetical protein
MPINTGQIQLYVAAPDGGVTVTINYDPAWLETDPGRDPGLAPIINVGGAALRAENTSPRPAILRVTGPTGTKLLGSDGTAEVRVQPGVTTLTANQLRQQVGIQTRGDVTDFQLASPD